MILPPDLAKKALEGRVTMACFSKKTPKCAYKTGHDYALQSGKRQVGRLTVFAIKQIKLENLDLRDAKRLGFRTRTDFFERWKGSSEVWLIHFTLGVHTDPTRIPAAKFGSSGDYVSSVARGLHGCDGEVPESDQRRFATEAVASYQITQAERSGRLQMALEAIREHGGKGPQTNAKLRRAQERARHHADRVVYDAG